MKKLWLFIMVAFTLAACNFMRKQNDKPRTILITHKEAADTMRIAGIDSAAIDSLTDLIEYGYIPNQQAREILKGVDIAALLSSENKGPFNGFYGPDNYRIEFYMSSIQIDTANPQHIKISGKSKYKENITHFSGTVTIDSLFGYRDLTYNYREFMQYFYEDTTQKFEGDTTIGTYHARGSFSINEDSLKPGTGAYRGSFYMDFVPDYDKGQLTGYNLWYNTDNDSRRAGFIYEGNWTSYRTGEQKPLVFAADLFMFGNTILKDFSYGEREIEINEKYRHLGWENYWEADEWWADEIVNTKSLMILTGK
ncbi:MAG TPA: hypothetical protein PLW44_06880 [Chitinophagales bacterium]|nr:hypothetical protein [Chitinophagales bacterium]